MKVNQRKLTTIKPYPLNAKKSENKIKPQDSGEFVERDKFGRFVKGHTKLGGRVEGQRNYATLEDEALIRLAKENNKDPNDLEVEIISKGLVLARGGDYRFYKDRLDRRYGTATNKTDITSNGEKIMVLPAELINKNEPPSSPKSDS